MMIFKGNEINEQRKFKCNLTLCNTTKFSARRKIKTFLKNKYQVENVTLNISIDPSVRGGFILSANNDEYDWSTRSRQQQLQEQIQAARDQAIQMKKMERLCPS